MGGLIRALGRATSLLPSAKVTVPYRGDRRIRLSVYADREFSYALNLYEPEVVRAFKALSEDADVVADVGAHMGIYSLLALVRDCEVHSFEPHPDNAARIWDHVRTNGFEASSTVIEAAVADSVGEAELVTDESTTRHSLEAEGRAGTDAGGETDRGRSLSVSTTTLDAHFGDVMPDLVKVDVEGAGADVLAGADSILREGEATWVMEIHNAAERDAFREAFDREGFRISKLDGDHLLARPSDRAGRKRDERRVEGESRPDAADAP